jgi:hypothetical protein
MKMRRLAKSTVSGLAAILLLLCQTVFAANACALIAPGAGESSMSQACHDMGSTTESGPSQDDYKSQCSSPGTARSAVTSSVEAISPPSVAAPRLGQQYLALRILPAKSSGMLTASAPPFPILHCRLLN